VFIFFSAAAPRVDTTAVAEMLGWDDKAGVSGSKSRKRKMSAMPEKKTGAPPHFPPSRTQRGERSSSM
jgi:hypothetical protein